MPFQHPLLHLPSPSDLCFPTLLAPAMNPSAYRQPQEAVEAPEIPPHQQESNPCLPFQKSAFTELIIITLYYKVVFTWNKSLQTQETISRAQL